MNKLLTVALATALCAPASAQKMGSTNSDAPVIEQKISKGGKSMSLNYTAITWAEGKTMEAAMNKAEGGQYREFINGRAKGNPLATFKTAIDCACGDMMLPAGEYKVYFTITDDCEWCINFANGDKVQKMTLDLQDSPMPHKRLVMSLHAGDNGPGSYIGFGSHTTMLEFVPVEKKG